MPHLLLISSRPGAGKTAFGQWLRETLSFEFIETDRNGHWLDALCGANNELTAARVFDQAAALAPKVVIEWGFPVRFLVCVRELDNAGFDTWWFDGDRDALRTSYIRCKGASQAAVAAYEAQTTGIDGALSELATFYGDRVINTVMPGPTYLPFDDIAQRVLRGNLN